MALEHSAFNFCVPHLCKTAIMQATPMYVRDEFVPRVSQVTKGEGCAFSDVPDCSPPSALSCATTATHD